MTLTPPPSRAPRRRRWTRQLAVSVAILMAIPVALGGVIGLFELNPIASEAFTPVGYDAHLLLGSAPDNSLVVEIAYQSSIGPPPSSAISTLLTRIGDTCSKGSITVDEHSFDASRASLSDSDLWSLELSVRQHWPFWGTMALFYLYVDSSYGPDSSVIGLAYHGSSIAVFAGSIAADSAVLGNVAAVTTTVMVHEFGHELGLVGIVGTAPNEDPNHPFHASDPNDVMYWQVDSTQIGLLGANPPTQFGAGDLNDLSTVRSTPVWTEIFAWSVLAVTLGLATFLVIRQGRMGSRTPPPK